VSPFSFIAAPPPISQFNQGKKIHDRNKYTTTMTLGSISNFPIDIGEKAATAGETTTRLVLIGGGHSHLQVIKGLNSASRPKDLEVVLIDLTSHPCYSGMVPSAVAGIYSPAEALVDLRSLAEWSGIEFVKDRVTDIDVNRKVVTTEGNRRIPFDALSIDIGSTSRGLEDVTGAKENTIPTRPISELVRRFDVATIALKENKNNPSVNVIVVGGGAAGIELSMGVMGRWKPIVGESSISVTVVNSYDQIFSEETTVNRNAILQRLEERGIGVINNAIVSQVDKESLLLESGERIGFTHCVWATGAVCHSELSSSFRDHGLAVSETGWIRVNERFQSVSHPYVFAAGDCCTMELPKGGRTPPKAGVYAVRAGPVLIENLTRFVDRYYNDEFEIYDSSYLKSYDPQQDFMKLLACGDGKALGFRFGIPIYGKWVFELKDAIDRSFLDLFKRENLPELAEGQSYDTSQYDASPKRPRPLPPIKAAELLQRSDDFVDYQIAWNVLRDMTEDDIYRDSVMGHIVLDPCIEERSTKKFEVVA